MDASGNPATPPLVGGSLQGPLGIDVDPQSGVLWVCERIGGTVRRYMSNGTTLTSTRLVSPSRVAVDSTSGDAWVTSFETGRLVHFLVNGVADDTVGGFQGPVGVAVDTYRSRVWVADPVAGQVVALDFNGATRFRVGNLPGAVELAIEKPSGEAWVVASGEIARISSTGAIVLVSSGLSQPAAIALDRFGP
jgi:DNA-binding beta-propeller fold protein YncE